jgi:SAM-dependent methyltransferase
MNDLPELPPGAFAKADTSSDTQFYAQARLVNHIDDRAIAGLTGLYREVLPAGGRVLDLMSSWVSHLPPEVRYAEVVGHGMNMRELQANPRLDRRFVQNLNENQVLPLEDASMDAACICVGVQYLQHPVEVLREVARVLLPGGPVVISYSNRCFPTKAVAIWQALEGPDQAGLIGLYLRRAGFAEVEGREVVRGDRKGDPLWAVIGRKAASGSAGG